MQVRSSQLDPTVTVIEVETGDAGPMVDLLETRGHGFTVLGIGQRMVVVDGRLRGRLSRHTRSATCRWVRTSGRLTEPGSASSPPRSSPWRLVCFVHGSEPIV